MEQIKNNATTELLGGIYKNAKQGSVDMIELLRHTDQNDLQLRSDLTVQMSGYEDIAYEARCMLDGIGAPPSDPGQKLKMDAKVIVPMLPSTKDIAAKAAESAGRNIDDTVKLLRKYENSNASERAITLARKVIDREYKNTACMNKYF